MLLLYPPANFRVKHSTKLKFGCKSRITVRILPESSLTFILNQHEFGGTELMERGPHASRFKFAQMAIDELREPLPFPLDCAVIHFTDWEEVV